MGEPNQEQPGPTPPPPAEPSPELAKLQADLAQAQAKAEEYLDLAKRAKADFLNYQDRVKREREQTVRYAIESFVMDFLPALESLRHTLHTLRGGAADAKAVLDGAMLVEKEFLRVLGKNGITPVETAGKVFDPRFHEAVGFVETADLPENAIAEEVRAGWMLHDRVLKPASVRIAKKPETPAK